LLKAQENDLAYQDTRNRLKMRSSMKEKVNLLSGRTIDQGKYLEAKTDKGYLMPAHAAS
jgi:hypothetical protein